MDPPQAENISYLAEFDPRHFLSLWLFLLATRISKNVKGPFVDSFAYNLRRPPLGDFRKLSTHGG